MKEIKFLLLCLYIATYTSLIWATSIWKGIPVEPNEFPIGYLLSTMWTIVNLATAVLYCQENWKKP